MKEQIVRGKWVLQWSLIILMGVLVVGCGHRSTHGIHHAKKSSKVPALMVKEDPSLVSPANAGNGKSFGSEGYFPGRDGQLSDLLQDDPLIYEESPLSQANAGSSGDYWANRTRAEQMTAEAGLRDVQFEFDSSQLTEQAKNILSSNAEWIKAHPDAIVTIEGHCDDRGTQA
ncbi:MAG: OmpA family protein, partial [Nitrospirales bacterium]